MTVDAAASPSPAAAFREARTRALRIVAGRPPLLIVTDFDGTLSPISPEPDGARIVPVGRRAIRRLAAIAASRPDRLVVVVLSGRLAADVASRVRVGGVRYLGNHGIEGGALARGARAERLDVAVDAALQRWVEPARAIGEAVVEALGRPDWLFLEPKGPTVAFHFRRAPDAEAARVAVLEAIEAAERRIGGTGLAQVGGRRVIELRPEAAGGKGTAVERLIEREAPGGVIVLGDDVSDAEAFVALGRARANGAIDGLAVAVHGSLETPPAVRAAADVELGSPRDAGRLLSAVAGALEAELRGEHGRATP